MPYVWVNDVDAITARATQLGGKVLAPAMDIPNVGRMSVLQDPQGANFSIFMGREHQGAARLAPKPGTFVWTELLTTDADHARRFYCDLLGWTFKDMPMGPTMKYTVFQVADKPAAGMMQMEGPQFQGVPPNWTSYLSVANCDAAVAQAQKLGARVMVPAQDVPGTGRFSVLQDPAGAVIAIIALLPM
jgi:predicted enzyme related to lactoylglutathione lyase